MKKIYVITLTIFLCGVIYLSLLVNKMATSDGSGVTFIVEKLMTEYKGDHVHSGEEFQGMIGYAKRGSEVIRQEIHNSVKLRADVSDKISVTWFVRKSDRGELVYGPCIVSRETGSMFQLVTPSR